MEAQRAECHTIVLALSHHNAAREHGGGCRFPVHFHFRAYHGFEAVGILGGTYHKEKVAGVNRGAGFGYCHNSVVAHDSGYNEICLYHVVELDDGHIVYQLVAYLDGEYEGLEAGVFLFFFDFAYFLVGVDAENSLDYKHRQDYAYNAEGVCGRVSACHKVGFFGGLCHLGYRLLGSGKAGGVGDGTAHNAHQSGDVVYVSEEIYAENYQHVQGYAGDGKNVEAHAAFFER